jgi:hypothetical protein
VAPCRPGGEGDGCVGELAQGVPGLARRGPGWRRRFAREALGGFTVDTNLFRELGQYLVGRNSTALIELVKNAYDADATELIVSGEELRSAERGSITLVDNGTGMSPGDLSARLPPGRVSIEDRG